MSFLANIVKFGSVNAHMLAVNGRAQNNVKNHGPVSFL